MKNSLSAPRRARITPRLPARADSRKRFQALTAVVETLLNTHEPSEITIQMIARKAKMPTATVYHFFPSAEAALLAQARVYFQEFKAIVDLPTPAAERTSWQNARRWTAERARRHYMSNLARMRLLLGADVPRDVQTAGSDANVRLGQLFAKQFEDETMLVAAPGFDAVCTNAIEISDTFWRLSFQRSETITDAYFDESMLAVTAYLRCYLPEVLVFRPVD